MHSPILYIELCYIASAVGINKCLCTHPTPHEEKLPPVPVPLRTQRISSYLGICAWCVVPGVAAPPVSVGPTSWSPYPHPCRLWPPPTPPSCERAHKPLPKICPPIAFCPGLGCGGLFCGTKGTKANELVGAGVLLGSWVMMLKLLFPPRPTGPAVNPLPPAAFMALGPGPRPPPLPVPNDCALSAACV